MRLEAQIARPSWTLIPKWPSKAHPIEGEINAKEFSIRKSNIRRDSLQVEAEGRFTTDASRTRIDVRLLFSEWGIGFLLVWETTTIAVQLVIISLVLTHGIPSARNPVLALPTFMALVAILTYVVRRLQARSDRRFLLDFLKRILDVTEVTDMPTSARM
jgi:hypothetical protein